MRWMGGAGCVVCERKFCIHRLVCDLIVRAWVQVS